MEELSKFNIETQKTWRNYQNLTLKPRKNGKIVYILEQIKDTVGNRTRPSLQGGPIQISYSVPLGVIYIQGGPGVLQSMNIYR